MFYEGSTEIHSNFLYNSYSLQKNPKEALYQEGVSEIIL